MEKSSSLRIQDLPDPDSIRLFVSHIPPAWGEDEIRFCFETFGRIYLVDVVTQDINSIPGQKSTGSSCFIIYHTRKSSIEAQIAWNNLKKLSGMDQPVQMQIAEKERILDRKVFLEMLSNKMDTLDLCILLKSFGLVEECGIFREINELSKGFGYAIFAAKTHLMNAIQSLHGKVILEERTSPIIMTLATCSPGGDETNSDKNNPRDASERLTPSVPPGFDPIPTNAAKRFDYAKQLSNYKVLRGHADEITQNPFERSSSPLSQAACVGASEDEKLIASNCLKTPAKADHKQENNVGISKCGIINTTLPDSIKNISSKQEAPTPSPKIWVLKYSDVVKEDKSYIKLSTMKEIVTPEPHSDETQESNQEISKILAMDFQDVPFKYGAAEGWSVPNGFADSGGGGDTVATTVSNFTCSSNYQEEETILKSHSRTTPREDVAGAGSPANENTPKLKVFQSSCSLGAPNSGKTMATNTTNFGVGATKVSKGVQSGKGDSTKDFVIEITNDVITAGGGASKVNNPSANHMSVQTDSHSSIRHAVGGKIGQNPSTSSCQTNIPKASASTVDAIFQDGYPWPPRDHCNIGYPSTTVMTHHHHTSMNSVRTTISGAGGRSHFTSGHNFNLQVQSQQHRANPNVVSSQYGNGGSNIHRVGLQGNYRANNQRNYPQTQGPCMQAQIGGPHISPYAAAGVQASNGMMGHMGHMGNNPYPHPNSIHFLAPYSGNIPCTYTNLVRNISPNTDFVYATNTNPANSGVLPNCEYGNMACMSGDISGSRLGFQTGACSYSQNPHSIQTHSHNGIMPSLPFVEFYNLNNGYSNVMQQSRNGSKLYKRRRQLM